MFSDFVRTKHGSTSRLKTTDIREERRGIQGLSELLRKGLPNYNESHSHF
jgi:hypothetical protein